MTLCDLWLGYCQLRDFVLCEAGMQFVTVGMTPAVAMEIRAHLT